MRDLVDDEYLAKKDELIHTKTNLQATKSDFGRTGNNWIEPLKQWILDAHYAEKLAASNDFDEIKSFVGKIGTNRRLGGKIVALNWENSWKILAQKPQSFSWSGSQYGLDKVELSFPGSMGGPVEVIATGNVIASQRSLWGPSLEEAPGYPYSLLASSYHWTWYDSLSEGANNWVMLANPNPGPVDYTVRIAGAVVASGTLQAAGDPGGGDMATPIFPGVMAGPVEVTSTGGDVVASQRVLWSGHFNEVWGTVLE